MKELFLLVSLAILVCGFYFIIKSLSNSGSSKASKPPEAPSTLACKKASPAVSPYRQIRCSARAVERGFDLRGNYNA